MFLLQPITMDFATGALSGEGVEELSRTIADLAGVFGDEAARLALAPSTLIYRVQSHLPVAAGTEGGLFWGTTFLQPGLVGDEYFMTKGHFHAKRDHGEYYVACSGEGALILMDEDRRTRFEPMRPGSVHYVPSCMAHRVANTGASVLSFFACWPSDAGHDYDSILRDGFSARLRCVGGQPELVSTP
jgi:glucose-6-phosphate isomerase